MSDTELRALTLLGFDELRQASGGIGSINRAVAGRVFRAVGPGAALVRPVHEAVTRGVFAGLGLGTRAIGMATAAAVGRRDAPALSTTPHGSALIAAVTGLRGDALEAEGSPLCEPMAVRVDGEPVGLDPDSLREAFPDASSRVVVFVHGLMTTEFSWSLGGREPYGDRLARELGCTPRVRPLQHRPPHLRERALAERADGGSSWTPGRWRPSRSRSWATRWAGSWPAAPAATRPRTARDWVPARHAQRLARHAPHGRAARAGGARAERRPRRAAGDAPVRQLPAPPQQRHPRPSPGVARGRGLARLRSGRPARRGVRGDPAARGRHALLRVGGDHPQRASPARPPARGHARARPERIRPQPRRAGSPSRTSTGCTSAPRPTSRCSTTPPSTSGCGTGSRLAPVPA